MYKLTKDSNNGGKSRLIGIFNTKEKAEEYVHELLYVCGDLAMYENIEHGMSTYMPYQYNIEEIQIDPKVVEDKPKALFVYGNCLCSNGEKEMVFGYSAHDIPKKNTRNYFEQDDMDDYNYLFGFLLDVSGLDENISIDDYHEYIREKALKFVTKNLNE